MEGIDSRVEALARILSEKVIAVMRFNLEDDWRAAVSAAIDGGIRLVEITMTTPDAAAIIRELSGRGDILVGVGSVLSVESLEQAARVGARFYASPVTDASVLARARTLGLVSMPGALTPTEIVSARRAGADLVKVFPMPENGAAYLRSIRAPLPDIPLAPSGGVTDESAAALLRAGASALNVGAWLTHEGTGPLDPGGIRERAQRIVAVIEQGV